MMMMMMMVGSPQQVMVTWSDVSCVEFTVFRGKET